MPWKDTEGMAAFGVSFQIGQTAGVAEKGQNQSKVKE